MTILYIILLIPVLSVQSIYLQLGIETELAKYAYDYVLGVTPYLYFYFIGLVYQLLANG